MSSKDQWAERVAWMREVAAVNATWDGDGNLRTVTLAPVTAPPKAESAPDTTAGMSTAQRRELVRRKMQSRHAHGILMTEDGDVAE